MIRYSEKTYGIKAIYWKGKPRYCILASGDELVNLNYTKPEYALAQAEKFIKRQYRNFVDFQGNRVIFTFKRIQ